MTERGWPCLTGAQPLLALHDAIEAFYDLSGRTIEDRSAPDHDVWDTAARVVNTASRDFLEYARGLVQNK